MGCGWACHQQVKPKVRSLLEAHRGPRGLIRTLPCTCFKLCAPHPGALTRAQWALTST